MVNEGMLVNGTVLAMAALIFFNNIRRAERWKKLLPEEALWYVKVFWVLSGLSVLFMGLRQFAGYFGYYDTDLLFFYAAGVPGALLMLPIISLVTQLVTGSQTKALAAGALLGVAALAGIVLIVQAGAVGPTVTFWGTYYDVNSNDGEVLVLAAIFLPGLLASIVLLYYSLTGRIRRELAFFTLSILLIVLALTFDSLVTTAWGGVFLLVFRTFILYGALVTFLVHD